MGKSIINEVFTIWGEKIPNCGEDSFIEIYKEPLGVIGVFDGCGGIGSKKYEAYNNHTGAYIASKTIAETTKEWFLGIEKFLKTHTGKNADRLKSLYVEELSKFENEDKTVKGDLIKSFPTTACVIVFKEEKKELLAQLIWAGDSRGYVLDEGGLIQLTRDDVIGDGDAYLNLSDDARLSNFVSASGDFILNHRVAQIKAPGIIISATDGCFSYFTTPMEFEALILKTMLSAKDLDNWKKSLKKEIEEASCDDFTISFCAFGFKSFEKMQKVYKKRYKHIKKKYLNKLGKVDEKILWSEYKEEYYG